jgi:hypothetical protein
MIHMDYVAHQKYESKIYSSLHDGMKALQCLDQINWGFQNLQVIVHMPPFGLNLARITAVVNDKSLALTRTLLQ